MSKANDMDLSDVSNLYSENFVKHGVSSKAVGWKDADSHLLRFEKLATLDNLNAFSRKGFAFNLLTSYVDWKEGHLYYADPLFFFDYCKKKFSGRVALLHDYPLWEWTMLIRKP